MERWETPDEAAAYLRAYIPDHPYFYQSRQCECLKIENFNTSSSHQGGHYLVSIGTLDKFLAIPGEIFRPLLLRRAPRVTVNVHTIIPVAIRVRLSDIKMTCDLPEACQ